MTFKIKLKYLRKERSFFSVHFICSLSDVSFFDESWAGRTQWKGFRQRRAAICIQCAQPFCLVGWLEFQNFRNFRLANFPRKCVVVVRPLEKGLIFIGRPICTSFRGVITRDYCLLAWHEVAFLVGRNCSGGWLYYCCSSYCLRRWRGISYLVQTQYDVPFSLWKCLSPIFGAAANPKSSDKVCGITVKTDSILGIALRGGINHTRSQLFIAPQNKPPRTISN